MTQTCQTWTRKSFPFQRGIQKNQRQNTKIGLIHCVPSEKKINKTVTKNEQKRERTKKSIEDNWTFRSIFRRQLKFENICFRFQDFALDFSVA